MNVSTLARYQQKLLLTPTAATLAAPLVNTRICNGESL